MSAMLKIFKDSGDDGIGRIQLAVNDWIDEESDVEIVSTETCMCSVGTQHEMYQCIVICVWYREISL